MIKQNMETAGNEKRITVICGVEQSVSSTMLCLCQSGKCFCGKSATSVGVQIVTQGVHTIYHNN